ncbi:hypothetical protein PV413_03215 [Streptomyces scabiei]|uniref:hypothetical protein n=1 Tax=Streptomyces scabiei TaxID=1930 RepID=UPI0013C43D28|nr:MULTISPECIES: hypothetical protein [Streptomyces]MDX2749649.1 hypothetical protein [Streptomyces scabiei]MDX3026716.1 hypothetical protein [Streptomyces scabiei]MDX3146483.1 hypothetical protein [Streptomyces scabiei]MDX3196889.1 hypothetical protein [Streptomyces scabiei]MDX3208060.1 hypothetical protein [Streptomyces scabiei]
MALPPLATVADLGSLAESAPAADVQLALRWASGRVRRYVRQDITLVEDDTIDLPGGERVLKLPQRPLVVDEEHPLTVVELAEPGGVEVIAVENRDYTRLGSELTRSQSYYALTRIAGWPYQRQLGVWAPRVRVTYSHGDAEIPDDIVEIVVDLAKMNLANPENLRSVAIDDYSRTFAAETIGGARLTRAHKEDLRPYRRAAFSVAPS